MNVKTIYLIRHGEINTSGKKTYIGITDVPLSDNGIFQAKKLKEFFLDKQIDKIYSSDLKRSVKTAAIIVEDRNLSVIQLNELREINMGEWEGKTFSEIRRNDEHIFNYRMENLEDFKPKNGESFRECGKRAVNIFNKITEDDAHNIVIVAHAGVNRVILAAILGIPLKNIFKFQQNYACVNRISLEESKCKIEYLNYCLPLIEV